MILGMGDDVAEVLRRAAGVLRERALRADTGEPWQSGKHYDALFYVDLKPSLGPVDGPDDDGNYLTIPGTAPYEAPRFLMACHEHADHIAALHPAVALVLADLLDFEAVVAEGVAGVPVRQELILKVARTYLGEIEVR
jgi:hypothetical protein